MTRIQIYLCTVVATLALGACDSSGAGEDGKERAAAPKGSAAAAASKDGAPAVDEAESKAAKEAEAKAAKEAELKALVADLVGEDEEKKKAARTALQDMGEEVVPYLSVALVEQCELATKSEDKMWGAHNVMKKNLALMSLLESYMGEPGKEALATILGEKELQGGWGASFTTVCASK